jgi:ATP-dependent DNA helicase RecG
MTNERLLDGKLTFLKGVGPKKAELLQKELQIKTYEDLLYYFPFRYEDRSLFREIASITEEDKNVQIKGKLSNVSVLGMGGKQRLEAILEDETGRVKLVWFRGVNWLKGQLKNNYQYVVYGKPSLFGRNFNISHPELDLYLEGDEKKAYLRPVYHTSEKMKRHFLDSKGIVKIQQTLFRLIHKQIPEILPEDIIKRLALLDSRKALLNIHFPKNTTILGKARYRLKFEELFFIQLRLLKQRTNRIEKSQAQVFTETKTLNTFYKNHLPFELTKAQKRVVKEIYTNLRSGKQMNRLVQGDVGSGKTIVAFLAMLMVIDGGGQATMMAPTEILAEQHYNGLKVYADMLGIKIAKLTGSTKKRDRIYTLGTLEKGILQIIVGTHALIEDTVQFNNLGLCIIDEQHRFGVAQRAKLWQKNKEVFPHVLVMTATPIPRTLAMTLYGDLDVSMIDELPKGRKPIETLHKYEAHRLRVFGMIREQIKAGRQAYIVYPLIEESEKMDYNNLMDGYESVSRAFPDLQVSIVHGRMNAVDKEFEMQRFVKGETQIMVATTVIEVGVDVPNATLMVIENSERFGLAQLHQLRGRVGRGKHQSYCILLTSYKLSKEGRARVETMVRTNNGFEIADTDLKLRGAGNMAGTQQSGVINLNIADLTKDGAILQLARSEAKQILREDPHFNLPKNQNLKQQIERIQSKNPINWTRVS